MPSLFRDNGLEVIDSQRFPVRDEYAKAWTDNQLMACSEVIETAIVPMSARPEFASSPSVKEWRRMYGAMVEEVGKGVCIVADTVVVVGKKGNGDAAPGG